MKHWLYITSLGLLCPLAACRTVDSGILPPLVADDPIPPGEVIRLDAAVITARLINAGSQNARVTVSMMLDGRVVHASLLVLRIGAAAVEIGPELTDTVVIEGTRDDGSSVAPAQFRFGQEFETDTVVEFVVRDAAPDEPPPTEPVPEPPTPEPPLPEPEPEPEPTPPTPPPSGPVNPPPPPPPPQCTGAADCDDGNACTVDQCSFGVCSRVSTTPVGQCCAPANGVLTPIDDVNACTDDACNADGTVTHVNNANPCDDADACTVNDVCLAGICAGTPVDCSPLTNSCNMGVCVPLTGLCQAQPINQGGPCDDNNACTLNDACNAGACVGGAPPNCDDGNPCTDDSCNPAVGCVNVNNSASCNDNSACTTVDVCSGGVCVGGGPLNCDDGNPCTDNSCNPAGGCVQVNNAAPCDDADACTTIDACSGGVCVGSVSPNCDDGNVCTDDACNPAVGCVNINNAAPCDDNNACTTIDICFTGACAGSTPLNCDDNNVCSDDSCNPAIGCVNTNNAAPCNDGSACTTIDVCAGGVCVGSVPPNCDDGNLCTDDSCNPASGCMNVNNASPCDDGDACTTSDTCFGGACVGGVPPDCDDGSDCTADSCDMLAGCVHLNVMAGTPCGDAADSECDNPDACDGAGACLPDHEPDGTPCPDGVFCNGDELCQLGMCVPGTPVPACCRGDGDCDNFNVCDGIETCVNHTCTPGTSLDCDDGNGCTDDVCNPLVGCINVFNVSPCDDGNACTTVDVCAGGICLGNVSPDCDDGNLCTSDSCNPAIGCVNTNNAAPCNDNSACTTVDVCSGGVCVGSVPPDCDDGNLCTDDLCNPAVGCVIVNNAAPCDDGNACTTVDACSGGACVGGVPPNCDDGNNCTDDSCNPVVGCINADNNAPCDDGSACTTIDVCSGGVCVGGVPPNCDDNNVCTDDSCNPAVGCTNVNNAAPCDDGSACTTVDACSGGICVGSVPPNCDDNNDCTNDSCNPAVGCVSANNNAPCNDGDACTIVDVCSGGICVGSVPPNCDDGNACTNDSCNPAVGCVNADNNNPCEADGQFCTMDACAVGSCGFSVDRCSANLGQICNEVSDQCSITVRFVNANAVGLNNGASWANAFTSLQSAMTAAASGDQIWVAEGAYKPGPAGSSRGVTFTLKNNVALYGGFAGTETRLVDRDPMLRVTVLSGDLASDDQPGFVNRGENCFHVVTSNASVTATTIVDGFTIRGGNASGTNPNERGGGIVNLNGSPVFRNCVITDNSAARGGGMNTNNSSGAGPALVNCLFFMNMATSSASSNRGGAINTAGGTSNPTVINSTFVANTSAGNGGGAVRIQSGTITVQNCILFGNTAGAATVELQQIQGSPVGRVNFSCVEGFGALGGMGNIGGNPMFANMAANNFRILAGSPCINTANNAALPTDLNDLDTDGTTAESLPVDLDTNARLVGPTVDMGAYEFAP